MVGLTVADLGGWPGILGRVSHGEDLSANEAEAALGDVLAGNATPAQLAAFLVALRIKGETAQEMSGLVAAMCAHATLVPLDEDLRGRIVDTCGTGGDRSGSINVSTTAAFVVAGAGVPVCKHGNRAASSSTGTADVLEALGVAIELGPDGIVRCLEEAGMAFCFAQRFHPGMRHAAPIRRELGIPTVFNFLGPLANPARPKRQVVGVSDGRMAEKMLVALLSNGAEEAMVVYGHDGLDELSTVTTSTALVHDRGGVSTITVDAVALGLPRVTRDDLRGGDAAENARFVRAVLAGEEGPHRDIVLLNAAAALMVGGAAVDLAEGIERARAAIDDGSAAAALDRLVVASQAAAAA